MSDQQPDQWATIVERALVLAVDALNFAVDAARASHRWCWPIEAPDPSEAELWW